MLCIQTPPLGPPGTGVPPEALARGDAPGPVGWAGGAGKWEAQQVWGQEGLVFGREREGSWVTQPTPRGGKPDGADRGRGDGRGWQAGDLEICHCPLRGRKEQDSP